MQSPLRHGKAAIGTTIAGWRARRALPGPGPGLPPPAAPLPDGGGDRHDRRRQDPSGRPALPACERGVGRWGGRRLGRDGASYPSQRAAARLPLPGRAGRERRHPARRARRGLPRRARRRRAARRGVGPRDPAPHGRHHRRGPRHPRGAAGRRARGLGDHGAPDREHGRPPRPTDLAGRRGHQGRPLRRRRRRRRAATTPPAAARRSATSSTSCARSPAAPSCRSTCCRCAPGVATSAPRCRRRPAPTSSGASSCAWRSSAATSDASGPTVDRTERPRPPGVRAQRPGGRTASVRSTAWLASASARCGPDRVTA